MKIFKKRAPLSFKNRLAVSYTAVLTLMLVIGAIFYHASFKRVEAGTNSLRAMTLSASAEQMDYLLSQLARMSYQAASSTRFKALSESSGQEDSFSYQAFQAQEELRPAFSMAQVYSDSLAFLYMGNSGYLVSPNQFTSLELFFKYTPEYQSAAPDSQSLGRFLLDSDSWNRFIPLESPSGMINSYLYICPVSSSMTVFPENIQSVLCFQADRRVLEDCFSGLSVGEGAIHALDSEGKPVLSLPFSGFESQFDPQSLEQLSYEEDSAQFHSEGGQLLSTRAASGYSGWNYYFVEPARQAYYSINDYQNLFFLTAAVTLFVEGIFIFFFTAYNSRPVARLSQELASKESLATSLSSLIQRQKPVVAESCLRKLMEGSITTNEEMGQIMEELGLNRPGVRYQALYTEASFLSPRQPGPQDMKLCLLNFDVLVREAMTRYFPDTGCIYKPGDRTFACLVAADASLSDEEAERKSLKQFSLLHQELLERYDIWLCGGFGEFSEIASYIWKSFQQAKNACSITSRQRFAASCGDLAACTDVYYFPESLAVQLSGFISTGSKAQVKELFQEVMAENLEKRTLSYTQLQWLIADVRSTVFRKRRSIDPALADTPEKQALLDLIDQQFKDEAGLDLLESISLELCGFYDNGSEAGSLITRIQQYIIGHYEDPSLSLSAISREFHISENYFSFLFKKEVSENFSSYLEKLRMAKAKELVTESQVPVSQLYQYVGYNNPASFRRVFKKAFGVSPKEMRDKVNR